ncbi:MAG TPA: prolyl oligopeptidase family serine peptidase [Ignavibacteriales bacterium]|nr:prolyl oligopeptidase family serine peptidase [Ignavibacteriales bacterium]
MKKITILFFLLPAFVFGQIERKEMGSLVTENVPEIPQNIVEKTFQYQSARSAAFVDWLPSGGMLIATRFGETAQVHLVQNPGGARRQITFFPEPIGGAAASKDGKGFLFGKDSGGNEFYQIYYFDMETGAYKMLTDGKSQNGNIIWSNAGDKFAYYSTKRNGKDYDIYVSTVAAPEKAKMLISDGGNWSVSDWSPDDKKMLAVKYISINESYPYILDAETGKLEPILASGGKTAFGGGAWSKDGKGIYFTSDKDNEFQKLRYYDIASKTENIITKDINWDVENIVLSDNGVYAAFTVNENGMSSLYMMNTLTGKYDKVKGLPIGQIYAFDFNADASKLAFTANAATSPGDIYTLDLKNNNKLERWTYSEVGGLNTQNFVEPSLIEYETFDQVNGAPRKIPAFYYKPKGSGPFPVILDIHGGPEGQASPYFSSLHQYLVNEMGIAVLIPNVRGSSGYGKSYLLLDNGFKREESVQDIGSLIEWIEKNPELDKNKICVYGGSYGGFMVLASMAKYNDKIKCGIDIVGISNFVTFLNNTQDYRRDLRRAEYGDERDPKMREFLEKVSPTTNAHKISKPLYVVQGLNDPRVPYTEAEQIVKEVRKNNTPVWYLLAKDEGHGFRKKTNRDYLTNSMILFLENNLLK